MDNKQQKPEPQQAQGPQLTEEQLRDHYQRMFNQAPTVVEIIKQDKSQTVEKVPKQEKQNVQVTKDSAQFQKPIQQQERMQCETQKTQEQLLDQWLSNIFELSIQNSTFLQNKMDITQIIPNRETQLTVSMMCDYTILLLLLSTSCFKKDLLKVDWLVSALDKLSHSFDPQSQLTIIGMNGQNIEIETKILCGLTSTCCSFLTTLVLFPQTFDIQNIPIEDPHRLYMYQMEAPVNELADKLYQNLFRPMIQNEEAFHVYMKYLDGEAGQDERKLLLELMLKRLMLDCQVTLLDQTNFLNAIDLMTRLSEYPNTLNHMMKESVAFYHPKLVRNGRELQQNTVMGRLLSLSTFPKDNLEWKTFFQVTQNRGVPDNQLQLVRDKIRRVLDGVHKLFIKIAKSKNMRDKVLQYFSIVLCMNIDREKIFNLQLQAACSSPGFINNIVHILLKVCQPFLADLTIMRERAASIDFNLISYLKKHPLLAKIYAQTDLLSAELSPISERDEQLVNPQFVGALYLLTMKALHYHIPTITEYFKYLEEIHKLYNKGGQEVELGNLLPIKAAYEVALLDRESTDLTIKFLTFECLVPMGLLVFKTFEEKESIQQFRPNIPFPEVKYPYGALPSTFLEHIHDVLSLYINTHSLVLNDNIQEIAIIAEFITLTLNHRKLVSNPHLRVKGIETIAMFIPNKNNPNPRQKDPNLHQIFFSSKIIRDNLIQGLIKAFVDAEKTGQSNQFYDKFRFRYFFCKTFNYLLQNLRDIYSSQLEQMSKNNKETFLEFANLYLNDMIFLLDECLGKMKAMKVMEEQDKSKLVLSEQTELDVKYKEHKRLLSSFSFYLHEYYKNIQIISECEPESFMTEEIREKLVNNMNYTVEQLNGENALQYKTKAMKEVDFQPKFIMGNVIELYINFSGNKQFLEQIVKDQRSFSIPLFENTALKLIKHNIITSGQYETFSQMMKTLEGKLKEKQQFDEAIMSDPSSVPDEFLDPILGELIRDPVKLPNSKVVIDRITIKKHLLNDKTDPFNRSPLTEDMLIEMPELKQRIDKFILHQMAKKKLAK